MFSQRSSTDEEKLCPLSSWTRFGTYAGLPYFCLEFYGFLMASSVSGDSFGSGYDDAVPKDDQYKQKLTNGGTDIHGLPLL